MKYTLILAVLFTTLNLRSQNGESPSQLSSSEKFSSRTGVLIQRKFIPVASVQKLEVEILHIKDLINLDSTSTVRIKYDVVSSYSSDTKITALEKDEIEDVIKAMRMIIDDVYSSAPSKYSEITYQSQSGLQIGCFWSDQKKKRTTFIQLEKSDTKSFVVLKKEDFIQLIQTLAKATKYL